VINDALKLVDLNIKNRENYDNKPNELGVIYAGTYKNNRELRERLKTKAERKILVLEAQNNGEFEKIFPTENKEDY